MPSVFLPWPMGLPKSPPGWLADRLGQRRMLTWIVGLWSIFTGLTGFVWNFQGLIVVRFLFGAAEAGAFPALARAIGEWFHPDDRGRANGIMWMGARTGGALAPLLATLFVGWLGWRVPFPSLDWWAAHGVCSSGMHIAIIPPNTPVRRLQISNMPA